MLDAYSLPFFLKSTATFSFSFFCIMALYFLHGRISRSPLLPGMSRQRSTLVTWKVSLVKHCRVRVATRSLGESQPVHSDHSPHTPSSPRTENYNTRINFYQLYIYVAPPKLSRNKYLFT